jgi:hypothetical protein
MHCCIAISTIRINDHRLTTVTHERKLVIAQGVKSAFRAVSELAPPKRHGASAANRTNQVRGCRRGASMQWRIAFTRSWGLNSRAAALLSALLVSGIAHAQCSGWHSNVNGQYYPTATQACATSDRSQQCNISFICTNVDIVGAYSPDGTEGYCSSTETTTGSAADCTFQGPGYCGQHYIANDGDVGYGPVSPTSLCGSQFSVSPAPPPQSQTCVSVWAEPILDTA